MEIGVLQGYPDGTFDPNRKMTRAEMTVVLYRAMKFANPAFKGDSRASLQAFDDADIVPPWGVEAYEAMINAQIVVGDNRNRLRPNDFVSRAEAVTLLVRLLQKG